MDLAALLADARATGVLHLSFAGLTEVPRAVWALGAALRRLDLGHNELRSIAGVGALTGLEELWLNGNPLEVLPTELERCVSLRTLDLRHTRIARLPTQLSRLPDLVSVDLDGTRVEPALLVVARRSGTVGLLAALGQRDERTRLLEALSQRLQLNVFREAADTAAGRTRVAALVADCDAAFPDNRDLSTVINNAARLFGEQLASAEIRGIAQRFDALRDDNERKALGAELELCLRAVYYDKADPRVVTRVREAVIAALPSLDDAAFLLRHAKALLPPRVTDIEPQALLAALRALRARLKADRDAAVASLGRALALAYPDRDASDSDALARACAGLLASSDDIRALAADAAELFPPEFASARPRKVVKAFREAQAEKLGK